MTFTALHRAAGAGPGPITAELLDAAITAGAEETDGLDWKQSLPPDRDLKDSDFTKDVAAMANNLGGVIVYGVTEDQKAATGREPITFSNDFEHTERTMRALACTAITPPILGLDIIALGSQQDRALVVIVPDSPDGPHLIFRKDLFAAPFRNGADTLWAGEHQIEAMYRARFEEQRHATEALDRLYAEAADAHDTTERAWLIGVAHPRIPVFGQKLTRDQACTILQGAINYWEIANAGTSMAHPLLNVDATNPRPGLRRWTARPLQQSGNWVKESWAAVHHDGSVSIATQIGAEPTPPPNQLQGWQIREASIEYTVADLLALIRQTAGTVGTAEYEIRIVIGWAGPQDLMILDRDPIGLDRDGSSVPLRRYTPVETTIDATENSADYYRHLHDLATDCINQGGITETTMIPAPPEAQE